MFAWRAEDPRYDESQGSPRLRRIVRVKPMIQTRYPLLVALMLIVVETPCADSKTCRCSSTVVARGGCSIVSLARRLSHGIGGE
jgi:hypothetical protein